MHILIIGMNYHPEEIGIGPFTAELSRYLAGQGHEIAVVTAFPHYPEWNTHSGYRSSLFRREMFEEVTVFRTCAYIPRTPSRFRRILYDGSFSFAALLSALYIQRSDVIVCICPPLLLGLSALALSKARGVPFLFHIQDLNIEAAVQVGMMNNARLLRSLYALEKRICDQAAGISVIAHGIARNLLSKGVPESKISVLPNWVEPKFLLPQLSDTALRKQLGLSSESVLVMYAGNLGNKQGLETLIDAAALLKDRQEIRFAISGDGSARRDLEERASDLNATNIQFLGVQPGSVMPSALSAADIFVMTQRRTVTDFCLPSKLLSYSAVARPVVAAVDSGSEAALWINRANSGLVISPEDPESLAEAILYLAARNDLRRRLGENAKKYVVTNFSKENILPRFEQVIKALSVS